MSQRSERQSGAVREGAQDGVREGAERGAQARAARPGTVYLVGAGPGDPGLLTLRGLACLQRADLVLYDYLANPSLVEHAPESAELIRLGHHQDGRSLSPAEITRVMVEAAQSGRTVVRLKGGDPSIFARGADEADALRAAGIPFEIVPGITSGLAVAALAEIPLTHYLDASAVALVTGRERDDKGGPHLDYGALARFPGTLVVYMGVTSAAGWSRALVANGRSPDTPVAIVRWCGRAGQQTVRCTLAEVAEVAEGLRPPALFVVGEVVRRTPRLSWFEARPQFGTTVLVAGSPRTAARLRARLRERGAEVIAQPVIHTVDVPDAAPFEAALQRLDSYDWLVFPSPNAVEHVLARLFDSGGDARGLAGVRIAALGAGTAERLWHYHIRPDAVPAGSGAAGVARALVADRSPCRVLLAGAAGERSSLSVELEALGAVVDDVAVYAVRSVDTPNPDVERALADGDVDWIAVTSARTAGALVRLYGDRLGAARIASVSPLTSAALRRLGREPDVEAVPPTVEGMVDAITNHARTTAAGSGPAAAGSGS